MGDLYCKFDMPQNIPLRKFNTNCHWENYRLGKGLLGRFEEEEITPEFAREFIALSPKDQKEVLRRTTAAAYVKLYGLIKCSSLDPKQKGRLISLIARFKNPRILEEARKVFIREGYEWWSDVDFNNKISKCPSVEETMLFDFILKNWAANGKEEKKFERCLRYFRSGDEWENDERECKIRESGWILGPEFYCFARTMPNQTRRYIEEYREREKSISGQPPK